MRISRNIGIEVREVLGCMVSYYYAIILLFMYGIDEDCVDVLYQRRFISGRII